MQTYASLQVRIRIVEVFQILLLIDPCTHGRDVKPEEGTANGAESCQNVDIRDRIHNEIC
jgi:hypothetical protein